MTEEQLASSTLETLAEMSRQWERLIEGLAHQLVTAQLDHLRILRAMHLAAARSCLAGQPVSSTPGEPVDPADGRPQ